MKASIIISLLCLGSLMGNAQTEFQYSTKDNPPLVNNGKRIPVNPAFDSPYKIVSDTPCYMYKKNGLVVVDCPGVWFTPEGKSGLQTAGKTDRNENMNEMSMQSQRSYTGNYVKPQVDAPVPAHATPAYPKGDYIPLTEDAPCYTYKTAKGLEVMECHGLWFPPNGKK